MPPLSSKKRSKTTSVSEGTTPRESRSPPPHAAGSRLDAADAPGGRAEEEDVAGHALGGEVLVQRADERAVGFGQYAEIGDLRDGAAALDRRHAGAPLSAQHAVDAVVV